MWERYCRNVSVIIFIIDAADSKTIPEAAKELKNVALKPTLEQIPLLILFNKSDHKDAQPPESIVKQLDLGQIKGREVAYYSISCKNVTNIDKTLEWIVKRANPKSQEGKKS